MELTALIVEDDVASAVQVERLLSEVGFSEIKREKSVEQALVVLEAFQPQLAVVDVMLEGELTGLDLIHTLNKMSISSLLVTSFEEEMVMSHIIEAQPSFFLRKPVSDKEYTFYIQQIKSKLLANPSKEKQSMFFKHERKLVKVYFEDILFFQSDGNYCVIQTKDKKYHFRKTMAELEESLPSYFVRIHRSYILNANHLIEINNREKFVFIPNHKLPIGKTYRQALLTIAK